MLGNRGNNNNKNTYNNFDNGICNTDNDVIHMDIIDNTNAKKKLYNNSIDNTNTIDCTVMI